MSDWSELRLRDVAEIRFSNVDKQTRPGESSVRLCNYMDVYGNGGYVTADLDFMEATATVDEAERFRVERGDVMITKDSESPDDIGIPAVVLDEIPNLVCGYHLSLIKPQRQRIDPVYLAKQLSGESTASYFSRRANGSTRYGLSSGSIASTPILIAPIAQQRRIGEILSTIDETIAETDALIGKYQQIKVGLMQDLFSRGVIPDGNLRPPREEAPSLYRKSPLGWIPMQWELAKLRDKSFPGKAHVKTGPFGSSLKGEHWVESGRPVITIGALGEGELSLDDLLFVSEATAQRLKDYQLEPGDVVFSRVADVGRSAVIRDENKGWIMSSNLMRISLDRKLVLPEYLQSQLAFDYRIKSQVRTKVNSGGRDVANAAILNQLVFAWPQPDEQETALIRIRGIDANRRTLENQRTKLLKLKQGLMHDLLTGRVPIKVNENSKRGDCNVQN